jgi:hypothetical protein
VESGRAPRPKTAIFVEFCHLPKEPEERMMAVALIMQFAGIDTGKYEAGNGEARTAKCESELAKRYFEPCCGTNERRIVRR